MKSIYSTAALALLMMLVACDNEDVNPDPKSDLLEITSVSDAANELDIRVLSETNFSIGHHSFELEFTNSVSGKEIKDLQVTLTPMMNMPMHSHSAPNLKLADTNQDGYYPFETVFIMAGTWDLNLSYTNQSGIEGAITMSIPIEAPAVSRLKSFKDPSGKMVFVSLIGMDDLLVGQNDFEVVLHRREDMMNFPAITNCAIAIEPSMPSMGHGSPNNINPEHMNDGHYMGKVNFTMDGEWVVDVSIVEGTEEIGLVSFDVTL